MKKINNGATVILTAEEGIFLYCREGLAGKYQEFFVSEDDLRTAAQRQYGGCFSAGGKGRRTRCSLREDNSIFHDEYIIVENGIKEGAISAVLGRIDHYSGQEWSRNEVEVKIRLAA